MEKKSFAFKLADETAKSAHKWQARNGVAVAGCTGPVDFHQYKFPIGWNDDYGAYC